ncbi:MAG: carbohydrate ABC transporter permease [Clostridia bacterium]|nr:carbohydrate ABC transporter permease [Clostridia bacterium]
MFKRMQRTNEDIAFDILFNVLGFIALFITFYPMYFVVVASFSDPRLVLAGKTFILPRGITLEGYRLVFDDPRVWTGLRNTLGYTLGGTAFSLLATMLAAYALSRRELPFRGIVMLFFTVTMFFSGGLIPTYLVISGLGMLNTYWVMVLPGAVSVYNMIIMRTFFTTNIPEELFESARLDGCSYTTFFFRIGLPLCKAIIAVISLYYAVGYWNEYYKALIYISDAEKTTLQMVLRNILLSTQESADQSGMDYSSRLMTAEQIKYALIVASTLPIMLVYPFLQKFFAKGVMLGSIKG